MLTRNPRFNWYGIVGKTSVSTWRIVNDEYSIQVAAYRRQVLCVRAEIWRAVLTIISEITLHYEFIDF